MVSYQKPCFPYCVMQYSWWGCRQKLTLITLGSERINQCTIVFFVVCPSIADPLSWYRKQFFSETSNCAWGRMLVTRLRSRSMNNFQFANEKECGQRPTELWGYFILHVLIFHFISSLCNEITTKHSYWPILTSDANISIRYPTFFFYLCVFWNQSRRFRNR